MMMMMMVMVMLLLMLVIKGSLLICPLHCTPHLGLVITSVG